MITLIKAPAPTASPPPPRIASGRAYAEVAGLFLIVLGPDVINALQNGWAAVFGTPPSWLTWWNHWATPVGRTAFIVGMLWLISLRPWKDIRPGPVVAGVAATAGLRTVAVALVHHAPTAATSLTYLAQIALTIALAGTLARRRGLTLTGIGLGREPGQDRRSAYVQARDVGVLSFLGIEAASITAQVINALPGVPTAPGGFAVNDIHDVPTMVIASIHAGICEELLLVATVVTALEAARRPTWQIFATGMVMRLAIHLYFGISAPAAMILAATNIWLFRRTRRLIPLVAAHVFVDLFAPIKILGGPLALLVTVAALIALDALITRRAKAEPTVQEQPS